jgi:hypothetical protein
VGGNECRDIIILKKSGGAASGAVNKLFPNLPKKSVGAPATQPARSLMSSFLTSCFVIGGAWWNRSPL